MMLNRTPKLLALVLAAALALGACSDDGANNAAADTGANNGTQDAADGTQDDDASADAGADAEQDTGGPDAERDTGDEEPLWVPDFAYRVPDEGRGITVNIVSGYIGKIENSDALSEEMTDAEIAELEEQILTEETRNKMINGWDCGDATEVNGVGWLFEARVLTDVEANEYEQITQNISGCVPEDSTEADAARVQEIIQHLDDVRADHFAPR